MKKNLIFRLLQLILFSIVLHSCIHDETLAASDPASDVKEYTNKSLWKEDEKYIKNVRKVFDTYADKNYFSANSGEVYWDYALTMGTFDESFLEVPVVKNGKINYILVVNREKDRVYFKRKEDKDSKDFFNILVFKDRNQLTGRIVEDPSASNVTQNKGQFCYMVEVRWSWTNADGSPGETFVYHHMRCQFIGPALPTDDIYPGGGGGGDSGGGGGFPYPEIPDPPNPCEALKLQTSTPLFKNNVKNLEGKTGEDFESGYRIGVTTDGILQSQLLQNKPGTKQVDLKAFSNTTILMHSHYDSLYPMFSPGDIIFFNQWIVWAQNWNSVPTNTPKIPLNDLTFTLVTSNGNYSFNFDGTNTTPLPNYTEQEFDNLNEKYSQMLDNAKSVGNVSGNVSFEMEKLEKEFLKFMNDKMNMTGLKLYKTTENGNTQLNLVNGNRKETPCPN